MLDSEIHEYRLIALMILRINFEKSKDEYFQKEIIDFVFENISRINNWDLVDLFIPYVFGKYFYTRDKSFIYEYVKSQNIWIRRIAIMTCFYDIKMSKFDDILKICELVLNDKHDLIHKAS
mgnify:FL=1